MLGLKVNCLNPVAMIGEYKLMVIRAQMFPQISWLFSSLTTHRYVRKAGPPFIDSKQSKNVSAHF